MDPNNSPYSRIKPDTDPKHVIFKHHSFNITLEKPCRVNYQKQAFNSTKQVFVTGKLSNGKEYLLFIDSGFTGADIILNDLVVKQNDIEIFYGNNKNNAQFTPRIKTKAKYGVCFLPSLKIGELNIQRPFCIYYPWHREFQLLGIPLWQNEIIFFGVSMMSQFKYIYFDNIKMQLEFSYNQSFLPEDLQQWDSYPFTMKNREGGIMVAIPMAGETTDIFFDTGGKSIVVRPDMWEKIHKRTITTKPKQSKFLSHQYGYLPCQKAIAKNLSIGNAVIKNAEIIILSEDSPYLSKDVPGYLSIWTFKHTSVVLDFEHKLMWVKE